MFAYTHCDGIMIGRAAIKNPWIFSRKEMQEIPAEEVFNTFSDHLNNMAAFYGERIGPILFRKFIAHFTANYPLTKEEKRILLTIDEQNGILDNLDKIIRKYHNTALNVN